MSAQGHSFCEDIGIDRDRVFRLDFCGAELGLLADRALWWPERRLLCVADLHLGKSSRVARRSGTLLPPYETRETLARLADLVRAADPAMVVCLGDSFDDLEAINEIGQKDLATLSLLASGRKWIWISGNHDPDPGSMDAMQELGGVCVAETERFRIGSLTFRHVADSGQAGEISAHYHPKCRVSRRGRSISRACFLVDSKRIILPAFGHYTGGLDCREAPLRDLMEPSAIAVLTGNRAVAIPVLPRK